MKVGLHRGLDVAVDEHFRSYEPFGSLYAGGIFPGYNQLVHVDDLHFAFLGVQQHIVKRQVGVAEARAVQAADGAGQVKRAEEHPAPVAYFFFVNDFPVARLGEPVALLVFPFQLAFRKKEVWGIQGHDDADVSCF